MNQNNKKLRITNLEKKSAKMKGQIPKQGLTSAEDPSLMLPGGRYLIINLQR